MTLSIVTLFAQFKKKKGAKGGKKGGKNGRLSSSVYDYYYPGSAAETNRPRRRDMERLKERRDEFLEGKKELLLHFLTDNDYFKKKEKREKKGIEKEEKKKKEEAAQVLKALEEAASTPCDNGSSSMNDAASAIVALCRADAPIGHSDEAGEGNEESAATITQSVVSSESAAAPAAVKGLTWCSSVDKEKDSAPSSSSAKVAEGKEEGDDEDTSEPVELEVSYAMRGVPLVAQPPTLIAELHEHQVSDEC
jgi:hypothetical protein